MESGIMAEGNNLIEIRQKNPLTEKEQKIVLAIVRMIKPNDEDFQDYSISVQEFFEMLDLEGTDSHMEFKNIVKDLMSKVVEIPKGRRGWVMTHWISSAEYLEGPGRIQFQFSPVLKPYFLQLRTSLTSQAPIDGRRTEDDHIKRIHE